MNCVIDKISGVVENTYKPNSKNTQYLELLKHGDALLNKLQKLGRVVYA